LEDLNRSAVPRKGKSLFGVEAHGILNRVAKRRRFPSWRAERHAGGLEARSRKL